MPNPQPFEFHFSPDALNRALLGEGDDLDFDSEVLQHEEMHAVARRIAGTHVDVVARFARTVFGGTASRVELHQFASAIGQLERLAEAADDGVQLVLLEDMRAFVEQRMAELDGPRGRKVLLPRLQRFLDSFAGCIDGADAERLARLVRYDTETTPLLAELAMVRGIGPRRLERLYCCGLYAVEVVADAQPADVTAVTGLPARLSAEVVAAARAFALRRRTGAARELRSLVAEFAAMVRALRDPVPAEAREDASAAVTELTAVLASLDGGVS